MRRLDWSGKPLKVGDWVAMFNHVTYNGMPACAEVIDANPDMNTLSPHIPYRNDMIMIAVNGHKDKSMLQRSQDVWLISNEEAMLLKLES